MFPITTLLVGNYERGEFREACDALRAECAVLAVQDVDRAVEVLTLGDFVPEVIVIAQTRPGEFSADQVDRLKRLAPLGRVFSLLGSWCEGEVRTGHPCPAVTRVYAYDWLPLWKQELEKVMQGECPAWGLPVTASGAEHLLHTPERPIAERQGLIAVCTAYLETYEALADACRARGYATVWVRATTAAARVDGANAAIWDAVDGNRREIEELRRLCDMLGHPPVITLMNFPRPDALRRVLEVGASCVVAKPYLLNDLFYRLDQFLGTGAERGVSESPAQIAQPMLVAEQHTEEAA